MNLRIVPAPGAEPFAARLADKLGVALCRLEHRRFPDGETYLRVVDEVAGCDVAIACQLRDPDPQLPGLLFAADTVRELGARSVGLVAPYLPYMRQDTRFRPGEALTSRSFARLVDAAFEWLVTVDPHLHRHASLNGIYRIAAAVVPSAPAIAAWVQAHVAHPFILGPDVESGQWVSEVAALTGCRFAVFDKARRGDREVELRLPDLLAMRGRTPVVVDDIVSSAHTMAAAVRELMSLGFEAPVCIGVHAVFAAGALELLQAVGAAAVVSCNTLRHSTNAIDVTGAVAEAVRVELEEAALRRRP